MPQKPSTSYIISTIGDLYRSTGNILDIGVPYESGRFYETAIVSEEYLHSYINYAGKNPSLLDSFGAVTLDGLFVAYSTRYDASGLLPYFESPASGANAPTSYHLNPFNPDHMFGTGVYNTGTTDAGTFYTGVWVSGGHTIRGANTLNYYTSSDSIDAGTHSLGLSFDADFYTRKKTELAEVKSVALRAPLVVAGLGYDTNGNPVPSGVGGSGWDPLAFYNPSMWKVGPVDLRWDDTRKVWVTSGGETQIIAFNIVSSDPDVRSALVDIKQRSFQGQVYGSILVDTVVTVYDTDGCYLNEPNVDLTARRGKAVLMYTDAEAEELHFSSGTVPEKYWMVTSICCPSNDCN